jgi:hypothetical protein
MLTRWVNYQRKIGFCLRTVGRLGTRQPVSSGLSEFEATVLETVLGGRGTYVRNADISGLRFTSLTRP